MRGYGYARCDAPEIVPFNRFEEQAIDREIEKAQIRIDTIKAERQTASRIAGKREHLKRLRDELAALGVQP